MTGLLDMKPPTLGGTRRVHRIGDDEEEGAGVQPPQPVEEAMPKGVYDRSKAKPRKKKAAGAAPAEPGHAHEIVVRKPRAARKAKAKSKPRRVAAPRRPSRAADAAFGVFEDGSVVIDTPTCKGKLTAEQTTRLVAFVQRLREGA